MRMPFAWTWCRGATTIVLAAFWMVLVGCTPKLAVQVDSIVNRDASVTQKTYVFRSAMEDVSPDDLYFKEFSGYVKVAMRRQGYRTVADPEQAAMAVYFTYGISPGRQVHETYTRPVYGTVGGHSIDVTVTERDASGAKTQKTKTVRVPYRTEVVGYERETQSYTLYTAHMVLEGETLAEGGDMDGNRPKRLWKTVVSATSKMNDLRQLMPLMIAAAAPYVGKDTGQAITEKIAPDDPRAVQVRQSAR